MEKSDERGFSKRFNITKFHKSDKKQKKGKYANHPLFYSSMNFHKIKRKAIKKDISKLLNRNETEELILSPLLYMGMVAKSTNWWDCETLKARVY